jgi:hypothetical protein
MWKGCVGCVIYCSRSFTALEIWSEIAGARPTPRAMHSARLTAMTNDNLRTGILSSLRQNALATAATM